MFDALGHSVEGTPWESGPADAVWEVLLGAEYASGLGEANDVYSTITYSLSFLGCYFGIIH